jgi:hypothetical protein
MFSISVPSLGLFVYFLDAPLAKGTWEILRRAQQSGVSRGVSRLFLQPRSLPAGKLVLALYAARLGELPSLWTVEACPSLPWVELKSGGLSAWPAVCCSALE